MKNNYNMDSIIQLPIKKYNDLVNEIKNEIIQDFQNNIREYSYKKIDYNNFSSIYIKDKLIKITCMDGEEEYDLTYGNLLTLLVVFKIINNVINKDKNFEYLIDCYNEFLFDASETDEINNYYDNIYNELIDYPEIKNLIFENLSELTVLSSNFVNGTITLYSLCKMYLNSEDFKKSLNYNVDKYDDDFSTMIKEIKNNMKNIENCITNMDSEYRSMILSNAGFNMKQASQIFNVVGPKPDIFGNIHPIAIKSNYLNGLKDVSEYYINADGARKALITNYSSVKDSGYLTKIISMLCVDTKLSNEVCCNTKIENLPRIKILDTKVLKMYQNRYFWNEKEECYELLGYRTEFIGKTLRFASPTTCSCKDGICQTCYGNLSKTNKENIGLIATLLLTEILTQRLLSTKHLLEANTRDIDWPENITNTFDIGNDKMYLNNESGITLKNIKVTDMNERNNDIYKIMIKKTEIELPIPIALNSELYKLEQENIDKEEYSIIYEGEGDIPKSNKFLFTFAIKNKELAEPLNNIKNLINTDEITKRDIEGNINRFIYLLEKADIFLSSEHMEVILRELVYTKDRKTFEIDDVPSYEMYRASKKVLNSTITKSILFERVKEQLLKVDTYLKDNQDSMLDFLL